MLNLWAPDYQPVSGPKAAAGVRRGRVSNPIVHLTRRFSPCSPFSVPSHTASRS